MGLNCEIDLHQQNQIIFRPGNVVSGIVRYTLDEEATFRRVVVSLIGKEKLFIDEDSSNRGSGKLYADINEVIHEDERGITLAAGNYEHEFYMTLPDDIPSSVVHKKNANGYCIEYKICYYVQVKFERMTLLKNSRTFKKDIEVTSNILPTLPTYPFSYEEEKKILKLFSKRKDIVSVKAIVENSVVEAGSTVLMSIEINNETDIEVKGVEVSLVEILNIKGAHTYDHVFDVLKTSEFKPALKNRGDKDSMKLLLDIPSYAFTVRGSRSIDRNYFLHVTTQLPVFHKNAFMKIPLEIDKKCANSYRLSNAPPSYWEAMNLHGLEKIPPVARES